MSYNTLYIFFSYVKLKTWSFLLHRPIHKWPNAKTVNGNMMGELFKYIKGTAFFRNTLTLSGIIIEVQSNEGKKGLLCIIPRLEHWRELVCFSLAHCQVLMTHEWCVQLIYLMCKLSYSFSWHSFSINSSYRSSHTTAGSSQLDQLEWLPKTI